MNNPNTHVQFNQVAIAVWSILLIPTMLIWRDSLTWIVFMSWYAIFVSHGTAWIAARAEVAADKG